MFGTTLVLKYDIKESRFAFRSEEEAFHLDIGLEDIWNITGLLIDGKQVSGKEYSNSIGVIKEHLNLGDSEAKDLLQYRNNKVTSMIEVNKLKVKFEKVPKHANESEIRPFVKAYLLYLLGQVILLNSSRAIAAMYLPLLDLEEIDKYAWGAAVLGCLKCAMSKAKKDYLADNSGLLNGFSLALTVSSLNIVLETIHTDCSIF